MKRDLLNASVKLVGSFSKHCQSLQRFFSARVAVMILPYFQDQSFLVFHSHNSFIVDSLVTLSVPFHKNLNNIQFNSWTISFGSGRSDKIKTNLGIIKDFITNFSKRLLEHCYLPLY